jgi:hypothetical protein
MSVRSWARIPVVLAAAGAALAITLPASAEPAANGWHPGTVSAGPVGDDWHPIPEGNDPWP